MLRVNEKIFDISLDELNTCDSVLRNGFDEISEIRKQLCDQSGLDEEIVRLGKVLENTEQTELKLKSMIKVINFAKLQYGSSEKNVINNSEAIQKADVGKYRLKPITIKVPYAEKIDWKKG